MQDWRAPDVAEENARPRVLLVGLGDVCPGRRGIGRRVLELLSDAYELPPEIQAITEASCGIDLAEAMEEATDVLAVDAILWQQAAGTVHVYDLDEWERPLAVPRSVHEDLVEQALGMVEVVADRPRARMVALVVGDDDAPGKMSSTPLTGTDEVVAAVAAELQRMGLSLLGKRVEVKE